MAKENLTEKNLTEIAGQVVKPKRSRPEQLPQCEPGENTKYLMHSLKLSGLGEIDLTDAKQIEKRITKYFEVCAEDDMKPSVAGMAVALGTDRRRLWEWRTGEKSDRSDTLKKAYAILDHLMNDYMQNGKINPVSGIFLMKNNFGYADKQEVVLTPNNPLGEQRETKEIEDRYLESVVDENLTD